MSEVTDQCTEEEEKAKSLNKLKNKHEATIADLEGDCRISPHRASLCRCRSLVSFLPSAKVSFFPFPRYRAAEARGAGSLGAGQVEETDGERVCRRPGAAVRPGPDDCRAEGHSVPEGEGNHCPAGPVRRQEIPFTTECPPFDFFPSLNNLSLIEHAQVGGRRSATRRCPAGSEGGYVTGV